MIDYTHLQFRADYRQSDTSDVEPAGREILEFIAQSMRYRDLKVGEPIQEDWGWCAPVDVDGVPVLLGCSPYLEHQDGWMCFVEARKSGLRRLFFNTHSDREAVRIAVLAMHRAVADNPRCRDRKWWTDPSGVGQAVAC